MKLAYQEPKLQIAFLEEADVVRTSGPNENVMMPSWFDGYADVWENQ